MSTGSPSEKLRAGEARTGSEELARPSPEVMTEPLSKSYRVADRRYRVAHAAPARHRSADDRRAAVAIVVPVSVGR